ITATIGGVPVTSSPASLAVTPAITSVNNATFAVGAAGTFTVTETGTATPTFSESGKLPSQVFFDTSTGVLSGTPAANSGGTYKILINATNGVGSVAPQPFTLTIDQAPTITSAPSTTFTAGTAGSFTMTTAAGTYPNAKTFTA